MVPLLPTIFTKVRQGIEREVASVEEQIREHPASRRESVVGADVALHLETPLAANAKTLGDLRAGPVTRPAAGPGSPPQAPGRAHLSLPAGASRG